MKATGLLFTALVIAACSSREPSNGAGAAAGSLSYTGAVAGHTNASGGVGGTASTAGGSKPTGGAPSRGGTSSGATTSSHSGAPSDGGTSSAGSANSADCAHDGDGKTTLVFMNGCQNRLSFKGSDIDGGVIEPGAAACVDIGSDSEALSAKRYWGFFGEDPGAERHTLAEFTFNTDFNDFDWYNISHVDAHNLPMQIVPRDRPKCQRLTCAQDFLANCPEVGKYRDSHGEVSACVSPERDNADSPVARYFEACDDAYAWSGDDQKGDDPSPVRACAGEDFEIVFCPAAQ